MGYTDLIIESLGIPLWALVIVLVWSLVWKAIALWKSARKTHKIWFIVLLVVNTMGILEILYIFLFADLTEQISKQKPVKGIRVQKIITARKSRKKKSKRKR